MLYCGFLQYLAPLMQGPGIFPPLQIRVPAQISPESVRWVCNSNSGSVYQTEDWIPHASCEASSGLIRHSEFIDTINYCLFTNFYA